MEGAKYGEGLSHSTVKGYHQYSGELSYCMWGVSYSTVEGASTVEGYLAVQWGLSSVQWRAIILHVRGGDHTAQ